MNRFPFPTLVAVVALTVTLMGCEEKSTTEAEMPEEAPTTLLEANMAASTAFLAEVETRDGIMATPSGLMYEVITEGEGEKPNAVSSVTVHYEGTLPDGTVFDSSYARGETISFPLNRVIPGWTEGLQLMSPGAKYKFYIPSNLAYGQRGTPGGPIGPNQALIFTVELFSFE
ncbi:MAG: FKBP-type peptidyl-prolyl cis-trans isomerase [Rhodothermales bacterium]|nr:FKBP-type peptidyl-prolyl cis-trans isomerase [Rhodothermales bacterium]